MREHRRPSGRLPSGSVVFPLLHHQGMAGSPFNCAHGTSTVLSCAFCDLEVWPAGSFFLSSVIQPQRMWPRLPSIARMGRAQFYRGPVLSHTILIWGWPGWSPNCARPTRAFRGRALREHRRPSGRLSSGSIVFPLLHHQGMAGSPFNCAHGTSTV